MAQPEVLAAALATVAVETAHTFAPVEEAFWMSDEWRWANLRYAPYWGRGYIQLTWDYNYKTYGEALKMDLFGIPNLALLHEVAAAVFAEYFLRASVADAALRQDWREVRHRVQGADAGLAELLLIVGRLGFPVL
jgi:predicted chitinase